MDIEKPELHPVLRRKTPAILDHVLGIADARRIERRTEGALLVQVEVNDGVIGVKDEIVVLRHAYQSCFLSDLSLMSS